MQGLLDNPAAGDKEQQGFEQGGEVLHLAVPVEMRAVGRSAGDTHRDVGHQRGYQIEARMRRLGQDAEAAGQQADDGFRGGERDRGQERTERGGSLLVVFSRQLRRHYSEVSTAGWWGRRRRSLIPLAARGTISAMPDTQPQERPWRRRNPPGS